MRTYRKNAVLCKVQAAVILHSPVVEGANVKEEFIQKIEALSKSSEKHFL